MGHGKDGYKRTAKTRITAMTEDTARQRNLHGNGPAERTTKIRCTAETLGIAVQSPLP
jgi:hypothetical protein